MTTMDHPSETHGAHLGKMETRLREWGVRLDELIARADQAGTIAQAEYHQGVDDMKVKFRTAQARINDLKTAGDDKWETFKTGMEIAWKDLEVTFKKLKQ
jgi:hypothetical protein